MTDKIEVWRSHMKKLILIAALIIIFVLSLRSYEHAKTDKILFKSLDGIDIRVTSLEEQLQDIQDNYITVDAVEPIVNDIAEYQLEVDEIRNNINDFNELWRQLFDYEQKQYIMRGK
jgi:peptidoglycan hydrolase CwlO-like protein